MKSLLAVSLLAVIMLGVSLESRANEVTNGEFTTDLSSWVHAGDVAIDSQEAVLRDGTTWYSHLYQGVALSPGNYTLEFDYSAYLSSDYDSGSFPDYFAASLYFVDDLATFDLSDPPFDNSLVLFDLELESVDSTHFIFTFQNYYSYAIPTFELLGYGDNGATDRVSYFRVDNVTIETAPVPEPSTMLLLGCGIIGLAVASRKKIRKGLKAV